ncbi:hypothetical protein [Paraburkholderia silvatlantica]|uniref:hypothetical protein n=1 Tax=Paraburkholderia silvatlantica TaxID=321895 RepID=UPI001414D219|nr:hypothetical protein [Paraburkholderia silvatlantica]
MSDQEKKEQKHDQGHQPNKEHSHGHHHHTSDPGRPIPPHRSSAQVYGKSS